MSNKLPRVWKYNKYSHSKFAKRLEKVGKLFIKQYKKYPEESELRFSCGNVIQNRCETIACHGGWALILLKPQEAGNPEGYMRGVSVLNKYLGFIDYYSFNSWASSEKHLWGNYAGGRMFGTEGYEAFGIPFPNVCTLADIGYWYLGVARRVRLEAKRRGIVE